MFEVIRHPSGGLIPSPNGSSGKLQVCRYKHMHTHMHTYLHKLFIHRSTLLYVLKCIHIIYMHVMSLHT